MTRAPQTTETDELRILKTGDIEWVFRFTGATALRLRDELGIDVDKLIKGEDGTIDAMLSSQWTLYSILGIVLEKQIENHEFAVKRTRKVQGSHSGETETYRALTDEFYDLFSGDILDKAMVVFLLSVSDSLPKLPRETLRAMVAKISQTTDMAAQEMAKKIEATDFETPIRKEIEKINLTD